MTDHNAEYNVTDLNLSHWAFSRGWAVARGYAPEPSETFISKMNPRDLFHFEEGKKRAIGAVSLFGGCPWSKSNI